MAEELSQEISDKLHPQLRLVLFALKTFRKHSQTRGIRAACAGVGANLLYAIRDFPHRDNYTELPVTDKLSTAASIELLQREIIEFSASRNNFDKINREALKGIPDILTHFSPRNAAHFTKWVRRGALPQGQILIGILAKAVLSVRTNRNPEPALQKFGHSMIFMFLFPCGVLKNTESEYSLQRPLTLEELKHIFDYACPVCRKSHSSEALRKAAARFKAYIGKHWPTDSIRAGRSHIDRISIRMVGMRRFSG